MATPALRLDLRLDSMVNIMEFCKAFNARTEKTGILTPVEITVYGDVHYFRNKTLRLLS